MAHLEQHSSNRRCSVTTRLLGRRQRDQRRAEGDVRAVDAARVRHADVVAISIVVTSS